MQRITGLPDARVIHWEEQLEQAVVDGLQAVMDTIADRILRSIPKAAAAFALVAADGEDGWGPDTENPPPQTGELAIPPPEPYPAEIPPPGGPPASGLISPDDLATITPLWQQQVAANILPLVAQVFIDAAGNVRSQLLDAVPDVGVLTVPGLNSAAAEEYLRRMRNTYSQVGDHLWATARAQMAEGFEAGESMDQMAARLRRSAGLSSRSSVLVARTSVIESSNYGSIAMARASGLQMEKEWIATPDLRTRPTHLAADGQRVPLNEPFTVGGYAADFPADPSLPPSERYRCRCTQGYVMPDRPKQQPSGTIDQQLPGTSTPAIEPPPGEAFAREAGETGPGFTPARGGDFIAPSYVRPALRDAKTPRELKKAWEQQAQAITGHPFYVDAMPRGISMDTAREYAEGMLQMLQQFPAARVDRVWWWDDAASPAYARVRRGTHAIEFNMRYASEKGRANFLQVRQRDATGWDTHGTAWGVRNDTTPQGVVYHEFAHIIDLENTGDRVSGGLVPILLHHAGNDTIENAIKRQVSSYASSNYNELIAEAVTDVMVNGERASAMSREIYDLLRSQYLARGGTVGIRPPLGPGGPIGEAFPKLSAPRPRASMTVAELRAEAKARGITVPPGTRKPDLVRMLDNADSAAPSLDLEEISRLRQTEIDALRSTAEVAAEVYELVGNGAEAVAIRRTLTALGRRLNVNVDDLLPVADNPVALLDVADELARRAGLTQISAVGERSALNRAAQQLTGPSPVAGEVVEVFRPGYTARLATGEQVQLSKSVVQAVRPSEAPMSILPPRTARPVRVTARAPRGEAAAIKRQATIDAKRQVGDALGEVDELLANGASERALAARAAAMRALARGEARSLGELGPVLDAMEAGDVAALREAIAAARTSAGLRTVGGEAGQVLRFDAKTMHGAAGEAIEPGSPVLVMRPGSVTKIGREQVQVSPATVIKATDEELAAAERRATRAAARARMAEIQQASATARLLADVDQAVQRGAGKAAIRQSLDPVLIGPEQLYAGADRAVLDALSEALDTGDMAKLRAAITRQTKSAGVTPIGRAGAKATFDPATMTPIGDIDIPAGARVVITRRGATLPGLTDPLAKAQVRLDVPAFKFDAKAAKTFSPKPVVRSAQIIDEPPGKITEIIAPDGTPMRFKGSWVKVEEPGSPGKYYGSALDEWRAMYDEVPGKPGQWIKTAPVKAYRYEGEPRLLITRTVSGDIEEKAVIIREGEYAVKQVGGEVQRLTPTQFERLYTEPPPAVAPIKVSKRATARAVPTAAEGMTPGEFRSAVTQATKGRAALKDAPIGMSGKYESVYRFPHLEPGTREWEQARLTLRYYQNGLYDIQNGILRHGDPAWRPEHMVGLYADLDPIEHIKRLDQLFEQSRLSADVVTYRGLGTGRGTFGDPSTWGDLTGRTWTDPAFSSSTVTRSIATTFAQDGGVEARLLLPRGTKAMQVSDYTEEAELLLPRGTTFRVVKDHGFKDVIKDGKKIKVRQIDVEVIVPEHAPPLPWEAPKAAPKLAPVIGGESARSAYVARQARLEKAVQRPMTEPPRQLGGGSASDVTLEAYGDEKVVRKVYGRRVPHTSKAEIGKEADAEILAPKVVEAFDVDSWATSRAGRDVVVGEFIEGKTFVETVGHDVVWSDSMRAAAPYVDSPAGRRLGLADYVMGNTDRNEGNWIITPDGRIVAIDHGYAFTAQQGTEVPPSMFAEQFMRGSADLVNRHELARRIAFDRAELATIRKRLEALKPDFEAAGRVSWHNAMMRRLREIEKRLPKT